MKIHPREKIVQEAKNELDRWDLKHSLTDGELIQLFSSKLATVAKYQIRHERHGDPEKEGGLE